MKRIYMYVKLCLIVGILCFTSSMANASNVDLSIYKPAGDWEDFAYTNQHNIDVMNPFNRSTIRFYNLGRNLDPRFALSKPSILLDYDESQYTLSNLLGPLPIYNLFTTNDGVLAGPKWETVDPFGARTVSYGSNVPLLRIDNREILSFTENYEQSKGIVYWGRENTDYKVWVKYNGRDRELSSLYGLSVIRLFKPDGPNGKELYAYQSTIEYNEKTKNFDVEDKIFNLNEEKHKLEFLSGIRQNSLLYYFNNLSEDFFIKDSQINGYVGYEKKFSKHKTEGSEIIDIRFPFQQTFDFNEVTGWDYLRGDINIKNYDYFFDNILQKRGLFARTFTDEEFKSLDNYYDRRSVVIYGSRKEVEPNDFISIVTHYYVGWKEETELSVTPFKEISLYPKENPSDNLTFTTKKTSSRVFLYKGTNNKDLKKTDKESNIVREDRTAIISDFSFTEKELPEALPEPGINTKNYYFQTVLRDTDTIRSNILKIPINRYTFGAKVLGTVQAKSGDSLKPDDVKDLLYPYFIAERGTVEYQWVAHNNGTCKSIFTPLNPEKDEIKLERSGDYTGCLKMEQKDSSQIAYISVPIKVVNEFDGKMQLFLLNSNIILDPDWQNEADIVQTTSILKGSQPYVMLNNIFEASYTTDPNNFYVQNIQASSAEVCYKNSLSELCNRVMINKIEQDIQWNDMKGSYDSIDQVLTLNAGEINFNAKNEEDLKSFWANQEIKVISTEDNDIDEEVISKSNIKKVIFDSHISMNSTQDMIYLLGMFARESLDGTPYCDNTNNQAKYFCNLEKIEGFDKLISDKPINIAGMFTGNTRIDKIDLSEFQPKIQSSNQYGAFEGTFKNMSGLKEVAIPMSEVAIPMSNADKEPLKDTFSGAHRLEKIVIRSNNDQDMEINFTPSGLSKQQRTDTDDFRKNSGWINNSLEKAYIKGIGKVSLPSKKTLEFIWQPRGNNIIVDVKDIDGIYDQKKDFTEIGQYDYIKINISSDRSIKEIKRVNKPVEIEEEGNLIYQEGDYLYIKSNELYSKSQDIIYMVDLQANQQIKLISISVPSKMSFGINRAGISELRPISSPDPWKLEVKTNIPSNRWKIKITQTKDLAKSKSQVICVGDSDCFVYLNKSGDPQYLSREKDLILNSSDFELNKQDKNIWTAEWGKKTKHDYGLFFNAENISPDIKLGTYKTEFLFSMDNTF